MKPATAAPQQTPAVAPNALPPEQDFDAEWDKMAEKKGDTASPPTTAKDDQTAAAPAQTVTDADDEAAPAAPAAAPAAAAPKEDDLLAGLNDRQRAHLADLNAQLADANHRAASDSARVSAFQTKLNDVLRAQGRGTQQQPTQQQVQEALKTPEGWDQLKQDYPSIAGPIEAAMTSLREQTLAAARREIQSVTAPLLAARAQDDEDRALDAQRRQREFRVAQVRELADAYPDFAQVKESPEFKGWLAQQTPMVRSGITSQHAADAIQILDLYNAAKSGNTVLDLTQRRQKRLAQAATTPGGSGRAAISRTAEIPDEFDAAWDALASRSAGGQAKR